MSKLLKYFPRAKKLNDMKDISEVNVEGIWDSLYFTGEMNICYRYLGLYVKFCGRIVYKKNKKGMYNFKNEYNLYSKLYDNSEYMQIDIETYHDENIKSFDVIKEISQHYDLKSMIIKASYTYS